MNQTLHQQLTRQLATLAAAFLVGMSFYQKSEVFPVSVTLLQAPFLFASILFIGLVFEKYAWRQRAYDYLHQVSSYLVAFAAMYWLWQLFGEKMVTLGEVAMFLLFEIIVLVSVTIMMSWPLSWTFQLMQYFYEPRPTQDELSTLTHRQLSERLELAVQAEDFEGAARLRDAIASLQLTNTMLSRPFNGGGKLEA